MSSLDIADRALTAEERRDHDRLMPGLVAWTRYLEANGAEREFDVAEQRGRPILARHRCTLETDPAHFCPIVVSPLVALTWARRHGLAGSVGTGSLVTVSLMVGALDYMRARRAVTFRPMLDDRKQRRRDGYFKLTGEIVARLRLQRYTPVLTNPPGPVPADRLPVTPRVARSALRTVGERDMTLSMLRSFLQMRPVTCLLETALREGRPLASRPPGRTAASMAGGARVRIDSVVVSVDALTLHAQENADFLGVAPPARSEVERSLRTQLMASGVVEPVKQFSTLDAGQRRKVRGWWRVQLAPLALGPDVVDRAELRSEFEHWRRTSATADRMEPATERAPVTGQYPAGFDPAWANDPEMREVYGLPPLEDDR